VGFTPIPSVILFLVIDAFSGPLTPSALHALAKSQLEEWP